MPNVNINDIIANPGAERAILSIILRDKNKIIDCESASLYSEHFAVEGHKRLYEVICYLAVNPNVRQIDSLLVYSTITDDTAKNSIDELGGMRYIDTLINARILDNITLYINIVRNCALKRMAYSLCNDIQNMIITNQEVEIEVLLNDIQQRTLSLILNNNSTNNVYRVGDSIEERLRRRAENPQAIPGYTLGWRQYDYITQGYKPNELTVFVAESKTGKSALLQNHEEAFTVRGGIPGLYIDTEMTDEEHDDRLLAMVSRVPYQEIYNGMFARDTEHGRAEEKINKIEEARQKIIRTPCFHVYMPDFTIDKVTALTRQYQLQNNIGYLIFDYIKLPTSEIGGLANAAEYQRLGYITTCLKDIAGMCNIPVISAAQANRSQIGVSGARDASNIGGSYRILQMATRLCFLRNKTDFEITNEGFDMGNQKLQVAYQRNGAGGNDEINIQFDRPILKMKEVS
jgi:replicative DNA helicase